MGLPTRGELALQGFRTLANRFTPKDSIFQRIHQSGYLSSGSKGTSFIGFSSISSISSQRLSTRGIEVNRNFHNPFHFGAKRFYCVDPKNVSLTCVELHRPTHLIRRWFQNNVFIVVLISSGVFITVYFGNLETVPYTNRTHWILFSKALEKKLGERQFEKMKADFKWKVLPPIHPESVKLRMIANDIIDAFERGLKKENVRSDLEYASENTMMVEENGRETLNALSGNEGKIEGNRLKEDEIQQSRKKGQEKGSQAATSHLDGINWEIFVVDEPVANAYCLPGGKLILSTGLLTLFKSDGELATIIGHEVGHAVARHSAEKITKNFWFFIIHVIVLQVFMPGIVITMSSLLWRLPFWLLFSRRMEIEADYIGLLLIASAGYDPRVAPKVFETYGKLTSDSPLREYLSSHPSGKKRVQLLGQVMEEALTIYKNVRADYIGILLITSAGYDPRVAPNVYEMLGEVSGDSSIRDYLSTHPSGKKRAQLLGQAQVMEEALTIYKNVRAGRGVEGFL